MAMFNSYAKLPEGNPLGNADQFEKFSTRVAMQDGERLHHAAFDEDMDKSSETLKSMKMILKTEHTYMNTFYRPQAIGDKDRKVIYKAMLSLPGTSLSASKMDPGATMEEAVEKNLVNCH